MTAIASQKTDQEKFLWIIASIFLSALIILWFFHHHLQAKWINVPEPPGQMGAVASGIGDPLFAYRSYGIILQNMGDMGGRTTSLRDYNYDNLGKWFRMLNELDPKSNYIPFIAAYYFGGLDKETERLRPLVEYLAMAGNNPEGQKWRWLAQAAYLARFQMKDMDLALRLADQLNKVDNPNMPAWARQMKASVLNARGDKEAAAGMLLGILESGKDDMHPNEINATIAYLCDQVFSEDEKAEFGLCQGNY